MGHGVPARVGHLDLVHGALGDHVAVDPISRQVFHVTVEQAGPLAIEDTVAIADHGPNGVAGALQGPLANPLWARSQVLVDIGVFAAGLKLVRVGELVDGDLVLVRVAGPRPVHQAVRLVFLVLLEHLEGARVQLDILAAGVQRRHAADRQHPPLVAHLRHHLA